MPRKERVDYNSIQKTLKKDGPQRLYLLYGEEDYLLEDFVKKLRQLCLGDGASDFDYKPMSGTGILDSQLEDALESVPFLAPRTFIEVRSLDVNKCRDSQATKLKDLISSVPDYCTAAFILPRDTEPDGRLAVTKAFKKHGNIINFTSQREDQLISWVCKRFAAFGKIIGREDAAQLIFTSGELMSQLITEIDKIAAYGEDDRISREDIEAVATRIPEAEVFDMTDKLSAGDFDGAASMIADLLFQREHPIKLLAIIGQQFRRLYAARVAIDCGFDKPRTMDVTGVRYDMLLRKLTASAQGFTAEQLSEAVYLCAEADYAMKSSGMGNEDLIKDLILRLAQVKRHG